MAAAASTALHSPALFPQHLPRESCPSGFRPVLTTGTAAREAGRGPLRTAPASERRRPETGRGWGQLQQWACAPLRPLGMAGWWGLFPGSRFCLGPRLGWEGSENGAGGAPTHGSSVGSDESVSSGQRGNTSTPLVWGRRWGVGGRTPRAWGQRPVEPWAGN